MIWYKALHTSMPTMGSKVRLTLQSHYTLSRGTISVHTDEYEQGSKHVTQVLCLEILLVGT